MLKKITKKIFEKIKFRSQIVKKRVRLSVYIRHMRDEKNIIIKY